MAAALEPPRSPTSGRVGRRGESSQSSSRDPTSPSAASRLAHLRAPLQDWSALSLPTRDPRSEQDDPTQRFLRQISDIQSGPLQDLQAAVLEAHALHRHALGAALPEEERQALARAEDCAQRAGRAASRACSDLQGLKSTCASAANLDGTTKSLTSQSLAGVSAQLQGLLQDYFQAQQRFRMEMEAKATRQVRAAFPEADDSIIADLIAGSSQASGILNDALNASQPGRALNDRLALQLARDRRRDLVGLVQAAQELAKLVRDVDILIGAQGEVINDIERHVAATRGRTAGVVQELQEVRTSRRRCRRRWCCLICAVLLLAVFFAAYWWKTFFS